MQKTLVCLTAALCVVAADIRADVLDEIVVSATRRDTLASDVTLSLDVLREDEIRPLLTDSLADAVGVFVQQTTPGQGAAIVRGLKGSSVLHTVDGFRLNNAIFRSAPTQYLSLVPTAGVERIEVVRGSPTSLYGSDAVGGVVQVVTRRPVFETRGQRGEVSLRLDSAELLQSIQGGFETGDQHWGVGVWANHMSAGDRQTGDGGRVGPTSFEASGARANLYLSPSEERDFFVDVQYQHQPSTPRYDELVAGFGQLEPDSDEYRFAPNTRRFVHAQYRESFSSIDWTINAGWQQVDDDRVTRNFGSDQRRSEQNRSTLSGIVSRWSGNRARNSWVVGVETYRDDVDSARFETDISNGSTSILSARFPDGSSIDQVAAFANASQQVADRINLSGGLRIGQVDVDLAATSLTAASAFSVEDVSGDVGLLVDLPAGLRWSTNIGYGFRAPNIFDLGTLGNRPGNRFNIPNTQLDSEKAWQFDTGVRLVAERLRAEVVIYSLDYSDRITSVSTGNVTADGRDVVQSVNAAETRIYGLEAGFDVDLSDRTTLHGILNVTRGEQEVGGLTEPADRIPPVNGRLWLETEHSDHLAWELGIRFADRQERLAARDTRDNRIDPEGTAGWLIAGFRINMRLDNGIELDLGADNLLDKRYRVHGSGIDAPGRNISLGIRKRWQ